MAEPNDSSDDSSNTQMTQMDAVTEGRLVLPPTTSERRATRPKKEYPPGPPGKILIFRWTRVDPVTGKTIRAHGRPFPLWVDP